MKQIISATLVSLALLAAPVLAAPKPKVKKFPTQQEVKCPIKLVVTGTVVIKPGKIKRFKNSIIVNDFIWWEGSTLKLRLKNNKWVKLRLVKVEHGRAIFELLGRRGRPPQFQVKTKQSSTWGLTKKKKK